MTTISKTNTDSNHLEEYRPSRDIWEKQIHEPDRNDIGLKVAQYLIDQEGLKKAVDPLVRWNDTMCIPSLTRQELIEIFRSAKKYHERDDSKKKGPKDDKKSGADLLLDLLLSDPSMVLFNSDSAGYIRYSTQGVLRNRLIESSGITNWLSKRFYDQFKAVTGADTVKSVQRILEAKAIYEGPEITLYTRVGSHDGKIYFDIYNNSKEYVEIDAGTTKLLPSTKIIFSESPVAKQAPVSTVPIHIDQLLGLYKLQNQSDELLLKVLLVYYFIPDVTYPIAYFFGDYGSGKSSICRLIRNICDPSVADISEFPKKEDDFVNQLSQSYITVFDNVSYLSQEQSNRLCRAATGGTLQKRKLYTNSDVIVTSYKRPVVLNGINLGGNKPDFMDRCILFKLDRIPETARKTEAELGAYISESLPGCRAFCLDILSKAMQLKNEGATKPPSLDRMADYCEWGWYIAQALGHSPEEFISALHSNKSNQVFESLSSNTIAQSIISFMDKGKRYWSGTPTMLFDALKQEFPDLAHTIKAPQSLTRSLNELKTNLKQIGIEIEMGKEDESTRFIRIIKKNNDTTSTDGPDDMRTVTGGVNSQDPGF